LRLLIEGVIDYALYMLDGSGVVVGWNRTVQIAVDYKGNVVTSCRYPPHLPLANQRTTQNVPGRPQNRCRIGTPTLTWAGRRA
jgi:hypothetical protein